MTHVQELDFGYSNARLKSMKTKLIGRSDMLALLGSSSMDELASSLQKTEYRDALVDNSISYRQADLIDRSLDANLASAYEKVLSITPEEAHPLIKVMAGRWDVHNIKTIILGRHLGYGQEAVGRLLLRAGTMSRAALERLNSQESVEKAVLALSGTDYAEPLIKGLDQYSKSSDVCALTSALEASHYSRLTSAVQAGDDWGSVMRLLRFEIDSKNVSTLLRYIRAGPDSFRLREALLSGGRIDPGLIEKLAEGDVHHAVAGISRYMDLGRSLKAFEVDGSLVHFEEEMENRLYLMGLRAFRLSTLSIGSIVGYLYLKETETGNIRKIVRGIEFKVPTDRIRGTLVVS